jgi:flagellar assembly factor FliW
MRTIAARALGTFAPGERNQRERIEEVWQKGVSAMKINTTRFGDLKIDPEDIILFSGGLFGFEKCRQWLLLADADNPAVGWLQCATRPEIAVAVVSPRRFVPDYRVKVNRDDLTSLRLAAEDEVYVLSVVGRNQQALTLNLKAPLIINLRRLLGCQVIVKDDQPLQYEFAADPVILRKSA